LLFVGDEAIPGLSTQPEAFRGRPIGAHALQGELHRGELIFILFV
jgi:hypothetical protein